MADNPIPKDWSAKEIKAALREVGISYAGISRDLEVNYSTVYRVINGGLTSDRVRRHIAKCVRRPVEEIWPQTYLVKSDPTRKGRPLSRGLYTGEGAAA